MNSTRRPIVLLVDRLFGGGSERVAAALANAWAKAGEEVHIVVTTPKLVASDVEYQVSVGVQRHYVGRDRRLETLITSLPWLRVFKSRVINVLYRTLQRMGNRGVSLALILSRWRRRRVTGFLRSTFDEIDASVVFVFGSSLFPQAILAFEGTSRRFIALERNDPALERVLPEIRLLRPLAYEPAALIAANSHTALRTVAQSAEKSKLVYVPNPLFDKELLYSTIDEAEREAIFLIVARLVPQKNHEVLLRAFALLPPALHAWRLAIVGDGVERQRLEVLAQELNVAARVDWHGYVPNPFPFYRKATVFVLPSRHEGQSNALLEAMWLGLAVVVSDTPALVEMVQDRHNGLVVSCQQVAPLANALTQLATDGALRRQLGRAAREHARRHDLATVLPQWDQLLQRAQGMA